MRFLFSRAFITDCLGFLEPISSKRAKGDVVFIFKKEFILQNSWREFAYVMGATFQAVFLIVGASQISELCREDKGAFLCSAEPFFLPGALVVSGFVYVQVFRHLLRSKR